MSAPDLLPQHLRELEGSGLTRGTIAANGVYSESDPAKVAELLNWSGPRAESRAKALGPVLVFPHFDRGGDPMGHVVVKPDAPRPRKGKPGKAIKYENPRKKPNRVYIPSATRPVLGQPTADVFITEGAKKALSATQHGFPTLSLQGTWNWCQPRPKRNGKKVGPFRLIPDLALVPLAGRTVRICYDSDAATNPSVLTAEKHLAAALRRSGATVRIVRLPAEPDGSKNGFDDFLVRHGADTFRELLAAQEPAGKEGPKKVIRDNGEPVLSDPAELDRVAGLAVHDKEGFAAFRAAFRKRGGSVRDLDKAIGERVSALRQEQQATRRQDRAAAEAAGTAPPCPYYERNGVVYKLVPTKEGETEVALSNFVAIITHVTTRDDGAERRVFFTVEGRTATGRTLPATEVPTAEFNDMKWVPAAWGNSAVIYAGSKVREDFRTATQLLSGNPVEQLKFGHTGWRAINGEWRYLHAGGSIGAGDRANVTVDLTGPLGRYVLPEPPTGHNLVAAVRALLSLFSKTESLAPDRVTVPVFGAVFRAVLGGTIDFGLLIFGRTSVFKSEVATLGQQCMGQGFDSRSLPGNWASTVNALEHAAFTAKDAPLVIDDFNPTGAVDPAKLHAAADRLFRAAGNGVGRGRLNADLTARPDRPPRGLIICTGEDVPRGHSLRGRLPVVEVKPGDVNVAVLTRCQRDAAAGLYAAATAGFLKWLAPGYGETLTGLPAARAAERDGFASAAPHGRTPGACGDLILGWTRFLTFARDVNAISAEQEGALLARVRAALLELADAQAEHLHAADPAEQFMTLVPAMLAAKTAHLAALSGAHPEGLYETTGWALVAGEWKGLGPRVGWIDANFVYLMPDAVYAEVQRLATAQKQPLTMTPRTLWARLHEKGSLLTGEVRGGKARHTLRVSIKGNRIEVLKFPRCSIWPVEVTG